MKNIKNVVFPLMMAFLLSGCAANIGLMKNDGSSDFTLIDPTDTSMLTSNCKAYIDAMRDQEKGLDDPYMLGDGQLGGEQGIQVENFL